MENNFKNIMTSLLGGKLTCKQVVEAMTDYLEGSLSLGERIRFQMHLGICLGCRNYLRQLKHTIYTLRQLPTEPIPPDVRQELIHRFKNWKRK